MTYTTEIELDGEDLETLLRCYGYVSDELLACNHFSSTVRLWKKPGEGAYRFQKDLGSIVVARLVQEKIDQLKSLEERGVDCD